MNTHILSETLSFLDINKYQDFCGQVALLNSCEHREQILTHWLLNTDYQKRTEKELGETWTLRTRNGLPHSNNFPTEDSDSCKIWKKLGVPHKKNLPATKAKRSRNGIGVVSLTDKEISQLWSRGTLKIGFGMGFFIDFMDQP